MKRANFLSLKTMVEFGSLIPIYPFALIETSGMIVYVAEMQSLAVHVFLCNAIIAINHLNISRGAIVVLVAAH